MMKNDMEAELSRAIETNKKQAEFYNNISLKEDEELFTGFGRNKSANFITKLWARLRYAHQDAFEDIGVDTSKETFLIERCREESGGRFLEIGCFRGTRYSDPIIEYAGAYTGIDLSSNAISAFQDTVEKDGRASKVKLIAGDLLQHVPDEKYEFRCSNRTSGDSKWCRTPCANRTSYFSSGTCCNRSPAINSILLARPSSSTVS